jgi:hypothetical protein
MQLICGIHSSFWIGFPDIKEAGNPNIHRIEEAQRFTKAKRRRRWGLEFWF